MGMPICILPMTYGTKSYWLCNFPLHIVYYTIVLLAVMPNWLHYYSFLSLFIDVFGRIHEVLMSIEWTTPSTHVGQHSLKQVKTKTKTIEGPHPCPFTIGACNWRLFWIFLGFSEKWQGLLVLYLSRWVWQRAAIEDFDRFGLVQWANSKFWARWPLIAPCNWVWSRIKI